MKGCFIACLLFIQLFVGSLGQTCTGTQSCLHDGKWNAAACRCDCFPTYTGTWCQTANCSAQPSACGTYLFNYQCTNSLSITSYCPVMCGAKSCTCANGIDACLNGGTFNPTTCSCSCPSGFTGTVCETQGTACTPLTCQNSGTFNTATCQCGCFSNYYGNQCENLNCTVPDPSYCASFLDADCSSIAIVRSYCPHKCGRCLATVAPTATTTTPTTTTPSTTSTTTTTTSTTSTTTTTTSTTTTTTTTTSTTTTTTTTTSTTTTTTTTTTTVTTITGTSCTTKQCVNGFIFDQINCRCPCSGGFSGELCETYNCNTLPIPDAAACATVPCAPETQGLCPNKCLCSGSTPMSTTPATTTTTCPPLACAYGLRFDYTTCTCPCRTGFSGQLCDVYDCNTTPTPDSLLGPLCTFQQCTTESSIICPFKCLCGGTTLAPSG